MELRLSGDQQLFRDTCRRALEQYAPVTRVREIIDGSVGFDRSVWSKGGELGWYATLVPEEHGGGSVSGEGLVDLCIIAEELGRYLHPGPFLATNIVAFALAESAPEGLREQYLPGLASGEIIGSWAFAEGNRSWSAASVQLVARPADGGYVLDGVKSFVHDAQAADIFLVTARSASGLCQMVVPASAPGVTVHPLETLDLARGMGEVTFSGVEVPADAVLGDQTAACSAIERQLQVACVVHCAESNGVTDAGLAMTIQYSKDRVAFGRPIGSYQALKHRMADHRVWMEGSFATTAYAARSVGRRQEDAALAARVAKAHVGKWSSAILHDCLQIHGGIGMTWEHDIHLYFRRAISNEVLYGAPDEHYRGLVDIVEGTA